MEIIHLLLSHPNIIVDHRACSVAINEHGIDLEALQLNIKMSSSVLNDPANSRKFIYAKFYNYQHLRQVPLVNKSDRDTLFEGSTTSNIVAFTPLVKLMAPSFYTKVLTNKEFIESLDFTEEQIVQNIIDSLIYGGPNDLSSITNTHTTNEKTENTLSPLESLKLKMKVVFILNQVEGDFKKLKIEAVKSVISQVKFENILHVLDLIHIMLQRELKYFFEQDSTTNSESLCHNTNNNNTRCAFRKIKEYCLDYIGTNAGHDEGYSIYVENDERMTQYAMSVIKRKTIQPQSINEAPFMISNTLFFDLYHSGNTDFEIKLMSGKTVKCHKTVLSSKNPFFECLFSGNWLLDLEEKYTDEMEYIVQYCYGFVEQPSQHLVVPLIKKAHEHDMKDLVEILVRKELSLTLDNFAYVVEELSAYLEEPAFEQVIFKFACQNRMLLYGKVDPQALPPKLQLCLAYEQ